MRNALALATLLAGGLAAPVLSQGPASNTQEQQVTPPQARYWMGATTTGGIMAMAGPAPGLGNMLRGLSNPADAGRTVELRLGSSLSPKGETDAFHTMPPGAQVNRPIVLGLKQWPAKGEDPGYRTPKGRILFYWGCGEKAGPNQPVVLTFDKLLRGETDPEMEALRGAVTARAVRRPTPGNSKTYGEWPHADPKNQNRELKATFPQGSTLVGRHTVEGTYTPTLDFNLNQTFMEPVKYGESRVSPSGAVPVSWNTVTRATGYSLGIMGAEGANDEGLVMWSSADRPATFIQMEDLAPAEVKRLIGLKAVLSPDVTSCTVPAEVVKATKQGSMLMFTAFGDEATFIHPPRPADPTVAWNQEWFARVSFKSVRMDAITPRGLEVMSGVSDADTPSSPDTLTPDSVTDEEYCRKLENDRRNRPSAGEILGAAGGRLGRLIGGRKRDEPADPRCVKR